jgi:hypothetical protein
LPLTALRDQVVDLAELNDRGLLELEDRLANCSSTRITRFLHDRDYLEGYYDQSHLIREFRYFTGASPTRLAARRIPESTDVTNLLPTHLS